jgi:hypothetical protein
VERKVAWQMNAGTARDLSADSQKSLSAQRITEKNAACGSGQRAKTLALLGARCSGVSQLEGQAMRFVDLLSSGSRALTFGDGPPFGMRSRDPASFFNPTPVRAVMLARKYHGCLRFLVFAHLACSTHPTSV